MIQLPQGRRSSRVCDHLGLCFVVEFEQSLQLRLRLIRFLPLTLACLSLLLPLSLLDGLLLLALEATPLEQLVMGRVEIRLQAGPRRLVHRSSDVHLPAN